VPINEAAKGLGVCATVLKKVRREEGRVRVAKRERGRVPTLKRKKKKT
jgi:hypothetical protein